MFSGDPNRTICETIVALMYTEVATINNMDIGPEREQKNRAFHTKTSDFYNVHENQS
jgi:hypothetical protein